MEKFVGLKELRQNIKKYIACVKNLIVARRSKPIFKLSPLEDSEEWEEVIDFTRLKKGGTDIEDILSRI